MFFPDGLFQFRDCHSSRTSHSQLSIPFAHTNSLLLFISPHTSSMLDYVSQAKLICLLCIVNFKILIKIFFHCIYIIVMSFFWVYIRGYTHRPRDQFHTGSDRKIHKMEKNPMIDSWEGFTSLLNGVNSPKDNRLKFIAIHGTYVSI